MMRYSDGQLGAGRLRRALYVILLTVLIASVYHGLANLAN
jgi:hypothetical protein